MKGGMIACSWDGQLISIVWGGLDQRQERLDWCWEHRDDLFEKVFFTDEKAFCIGENTTKFLKKCEVFLLDRVKFGKLVSLIVFGGISCHGTVSLVHITGNLNGKLYREILDGPFYEAALQLFPEGDWQVTQNNARPHIAKAPMQQIYRTMSTPLDHILISPDLNKIEDLWSILINCVDQQHP